MILREKNFTLIEMINVILIIGILAVIVVIRFINYRENARAARDQGVLGALRSAIYIYYAKTCAQGNCQYPPDLDTLKAQVIWQPPTLADEYDWKYDPESGIISP
jgi:MSHA pilin protein MshA